MKDLGTETILGRGIFQSQTHGCREDMEGLSKMEESNSLSRDQQTTTM